VNLFNPDLEVDIKFHEMAGVGGGGRGGGRGLGGAGLLGRGYAGFCFHVQCGNQIGPAMRNLPDLLNFFSRDCRTRFLGSPFGMVGSLPGWEPLLV
jgi:hypothetical protein